jgi:hypothetical protein
MEGYRELGCLSEKEINILQLKLVEGLIECFKINNVLSDLIDGTFQSSRSLRFTFEFSYIYPFSLFSGCNNQDKLKKQEKFRNDIKTTFNKILVKHFTIFAKNTKTYSEIRRSRITDIDFRTLNQWRYVGNFGEGFGIILFPDAEESTKWSLFINKLFDVNLKKFRDLLNAAQLHVNWSVKKGSLGLAMVYGPPSVK